MAVEGLRNQTVLGLSSTTYYYFVCAGPLAVVSGLRLEVSGASLVDHRLWSLQGSVVPVCGLSCPAALES